MRSLKDTAFQPRVDALLVGLVALGCFSVGRQAVQPLVESRPILGAIGTLAIFIVPGVVVGAMARKAWLFNGVLLGILGGLFVLFQIADWRPAWTQPLLYQTFAYLLALATCGCCVGAVLGRVLFVGPLSNYRIERPREP